MKVTVRRVKRQEEEQVEIACLQVTPEIRDIYAYALTKGKELSGLEGSRMSRFRLEDVCYFEALDEKVFAYTGQAVYEVKARLYEVERAYKNCHFLRCSKSVVLNLMQLEGISPAFNGRFYAHMKNGEKVMISRQYAPKLKQVVMGGGKDEA